MKFYGFKNVLLLILGGESNQYYYDFYDDWQLK
jgi:hypothetical protein